MDVIKKYVQLYPNDNAYVIGGGAASLWINEKLGIVIPPTDYDIHVETKETNENIISKWMKLLGDTYSVVKLSSISTLTSNNKKFPNVDIFINENAPGYKPTIVNGIPTLSYLNTLKNHECLNESYLKDIEYVKKNYPNVEKEIEYLTEKYKRVNHRILLLRRIL